MSDDEYLLVAKKVDAMKTHMVNRFNVD